jgi:hypothetical protein
VKVIEIFFKKGRFHVRVKINGKVSVISRAKYIWLKYNPSFKDIPKNYIIHHLDRDETNDDPSNLALMEKHQHLAYHLKHKIVKVPINVDFSQPTSKRTEFFPTKKPTIHKRPSGTSYLLFFYENITGKSEKIGLSTYKGQRLRTRKDAEWARDEIWKLAPNRQRELNSP